MFCCMSLTKCTSTKNVCEKVVGAAGGLSAQDYARKLPRTFSLQESDSSGVNEKELSNLQKVINAILLMYGSAS